MKLLLYIDSMMRGGAQRVINNIATYFNKKNYEVCLINDIVTENEYEISPGVKRIILSLDNSHQTNFSRIIALRKIIKTENPDTVLSFLGPCNIRMLLSTVGLKCKKIVSVRNDPYREYGHGIKRILSILVFMLSSGIVFQTKDAQSYFGKIFLKRSCIILNPVAEIFYQKKWRPEKNDIICVGRLTQQKNPLLAVEAFAVAFDRIKPMNLVFYGNGELKDDLLRLAKKNNISDSVKIVDNVRNIQDYLETSRLFLMTSEYEGLPNALMEAMAVGIPVISTDCPCGGPRSLITHDVNGLLVSCNDVNAISNAIMGLIFDPIKCQMISKNERKKAESFDTRVIMDKWERFLFK